MTLVLVDAYEYAGEFVDGSAGEELDPTRALLPCEVDAARRRVYLPRRYFELRRRMTEGEAEEAMRTYETEES